MIRRLTLHLIAGMLTLAVVLAAVSGFRSYVQGRAAYRNLGNQNALTGARITQYVLEKAIDNGLFARDTLFQARYDRVAGPGPARYRTPYDQFFDRNAVRILDAFQTGADIYYVYVVNNDGFIPAHTDKRKAKTMIARPDAAPAARRAASPPAPWYAMSADTAFLSFPRRFWSRAGPGARFASAFPWPCPTTAAAKAPPARFSSRSATPWWSSPRWRG